MIDEMIIKTEADIQTFNEEHSQEISDVAVKSIDYIVDGLLQSAERRYELKCQTYLSALKMKLEYESVRLDKLESIVEKQDDTVVKLLLPLIEAGKYIDNPIQLECYKEIMSHLHELHERYMYELKAVNNDTNSKDRLNKLFADAKKYLKS